MSIRIHRLLVGAAPALAAAPVAMGYIHFPPATLQKLCKTSTHIRVLSVRKYDKEKGGIIFEVVENLKGKNPRISSFRHAIRKDAAGAKPILDWVGDRKRAAMFTIEAGIACGYVFIDGHCYSVDYNRSGEYWLMIRAEPNMSGCYHGTVEQLQKLAKDILDGKDVKVPVKDAAAPDSKEERKRRYDEVNDVLKKNRKE